MSHFLAHFLARKGKCIIIFGRLSVPPSANSGNTHGCRGVAIRLAADAPAALWEPIIPAAFLVFQQRGMEPPYRFVMAIEDLPGFGTDMLELAIETPGISPL